MRREWVEDARTEFAGAFRRDAPIVVPLAAVWLVLVVLLATQGVNALLPSAYLSNLLVYAATALFFVVPVGGIALIRARPESPISFLRDRALETGLPRRLARGAPMLLALLIFLPIFSAMKSAIPFFNDFTWDPTWIALDRFLHGDDPWRLLQKVLGQPWITAALAAAYHLWILLIYAGGLYFCFLVDDRSLRNRFFISFFAIWLVIGVCLATAFASVGPCFLAPMLGNHHFDDQMAYLHHANEQVPILVLSVQEQLLYWQLHDSHGLARGITAMPSMHVALAMLFALAMGRISRVAGRAFAVFCIVILVGSVHLAYHYAVDGYVSILVTYAIWRLSAVLDRRIRKSDGEAGETGAPARQAVVAKRQPS